MIRPSASAVELVTAAPKNLELYKHPTFRTGMSIVLNVSVVVSRTPMLLTTAGAKMTRVPAATALLYFALQPFGVTTPNAASVTLMTENSEDVAFSTPMLFA